MKLLSISLTNFRVHLSRIINFTKKITLITGHNASGKTSIIQALEYAFTGKNECTDKGGRGASDLITIGQAKATIGVNVDGVGPVVREIPNSLSVAGLSGPVTKIQTQLYGLLQTDEDALYCTLNSSAFLQMSPSERIGFLFRLFKVVINSATLQAELSKYAIAKGFTDVAILMKNIIMPPSFSYDTFELIYGSCFEKRKALKKVVQNLETLVAEGNTKVSSLAASQITAEQYDQAQALLAKLKTEQLGITSELAVLKHDRDAYVINKQKLDAMAAPNKTVSIVQADIKKLQDQRTALIKSCSTLEAKITENSESAQRMMKLGLQKNAKCPVCTSSLSPGQIGAAQVDLGQMANQYKEDLERDEKQLEKANLELSKATAELASAQEYARVKSSVDAAKVDQAVITAKQTSLDAVTARLQKGEAMIQDYLTNKSVRDQFEANTKALQQEKASMAIQDFLVEAFGSNGLKQAFVQNIVSQFITRSSDRLKMLTGGTYDLNFALDNGLEIFVTTNGIKRPTKLLSASEKLRVDIVVQDLVSYIAGLKILIIDNLEILDYQNKAYFVDMVNKVKGDYDNIIIVYTKVSGPQFICKSCGNKAEAMLVKCPTCSGAGTMIEVKETALLEESADVEIYNLSQ